MKKLALVLSGGGFKGAFQVGALSYLKENWRKIDPAGNSMKFNIVAGVSVGSLNGLLMASNRFNDLVQLWDNIDKNGVKEIYTSDFIDTTASNGDADPELKMHLNWDTIKNRFPNTTRHILWRLIFNRSAFLSAFKKDFSQFKAIADNTPLQQKLLQLARINNITDCTYKCGFVSLNDGKYYSLKHSDFKSDSDFVNGVLASTSMPIIWTPVEEIHTVLGTQKFAVDGGVRNVSPLGDVIGEICNDPAPEEYTIIIINCSSGKISAEDYSDKNIAQIALRSLDDIAIAEIFNNDIEEFIDKNYILQQVNNKYPGEEIYDYDFENKKPGKKLKHFNAIIIQPDESLGDPLVSNDVLMKKRIEHGRKKAEEALNLYSGNRNDMKFAIT
jgi:NTE family protein